jgi:hypothetical protein
LNIFIKTRSEAVANIRFLFLIIYLLMIFEGVLRKWLFPSISSLLFFVKDPFVLAVYLYAFQARLFYICNALYIYLLVATLIFLQAVFYIFIQPDGVVIYLYGLRNYLLYIPLIFVAARSLDFKYVVKIAKLTMKIAIPIGVLAYFQYISSPTAFVNKGLSDDGFVFMIAEGIVRPYSVFTFTSGHVLFVASLFSFSVAMFFKAIRLEMNGYLAKIIFLLFTVSLIFMFFTTGSRSIYAYSFVVVLSFTICNFISPNKRVSKSLFYLFFLLSMILILFTFTETYQVLLERNTSAVESEGSPIIRAFMGLVAFTEFFNSTPFFGYGIGSGTNAAAVLLRGSSEQGMGFLLAEDEWSRIVLELGYLLGGLYILFRIYIVYWLFKLALLAYKNENLLPIAIFGFVGSIVLNGVMTMQGTVLVYGVLFSSFLVGSAFNGKNIEGKNIENS